MIFHIIYTPGTVQQLTCFLPSLLQWSDWSFRLVANGCSAAEVEHLQRLCQENPRLELLALPSAQCMLHGMALNYLHAIAKEPYFCFMDSDIFATSAFAPTLLDALADNVGVFSCSPIACTAADQLLNPEDPFVQGILNRTQTGLCLGSTYLAIYEHQVVADLIRATGCGFETRYWAEIPTAQQAVLAALGVQRGWYDTGKVINLLLHYHGYQLQWCDSPSLHHLGGVSLNVLDQKTPPTLIKTWIQRLRRQVQGNRNREKEYFETIWSGTGRGRLAQVRRREIEYSRYFWTLLTALDQDQALPPLPPGPNRTVQQRLVTVTQAIRTTWQENAA